MSDSFSVSTRSDRVRLGADRTGRVEFAVVNNTSRGLRGIGRLVPAGSAGRSWFTLDGDAQRPFAPGGRQTFEVLIQVPATATQGEYGFRFDVIGVENPDADYGRGPDVTIVIPAPTRTPEQPAGKGYVAAVVGSVAGGVVGAVVGTLPGALFLISAIHQATPSTPGASLGDAIAAAFADALATALVAAFLFAIGLIVGVWIGPVLGAFVGLRVRAQGIVGLTVGLLVAFQAVITVLLLILLGVVGHAVKSQGVVITVLAVLAVIDLVLPALLARGAARLIRVRHL